jgi:hypothetical protein
MAALSLVALSSACSKTEEGENDNTAPTKKSYSTKNDEGSITGKISYGGAAPEVKKIDTAADAACAAKSPNLTAEEWVVKDGKVANTYIYIKDGTITGGGKIGDYDKWPWAPADAKIDQNGCHYLPHVMGVMANQEITVTNSDPTTHNIHITPKNGTDYNQSQQSGAQPLKHKLARAEQMVPVKCNQHPWMKAYIGVMNHPFFAVSKDDGSFEIKNVPPGKYTVVAWHEGGAIGTEKTMEVTVTAKTPATADFSFGASAELRGQPSSLQMMPAIEIPVPGHH